MLIRLYVHALRNFFALTSLKFRAYGQNNLFQLKLGRRMTVLFSATQTKNVEDLARISLKKAPLYVGVDDNKETATVEGLEQVGVIRICSR